MGKGGIRNIEVSNPGSERQTLFDRQILASNCETQVSKQEEIWEKARKTERGPYEWKKQGFKGER